MRLRHAGVLLHPTITKRSVCPKTTRRTLPSASLIAYDMPTRRRADERNLTAGPTRSQLAAKRTTLAPPTSRQ
jgi:hypothetical protein